MNALDDLKHDRWCEVSTHTFSRCNCHLATIASLRSENARMSAIVEAAMKWRRGGNQNCKMQPGCDCDQCTLVRACDAYEEEK